MLIVGSEQFEDYSDQKTVKTILIVYLLAQHEPVTILITQHEYTYANCIWYLGNSTRVDFQYSTRVYII